MARKKLNDVHRAFLVEQLACFMSPKEAADALREEFGISVAPQSAERYDPYKRAGSHIAPKWKLLFDHTRNAFLDHVERRVPEAHKAVRVRELALASRSFKKAGNYMAMADMLERIAKEMGNVHTNRREYTGRDRGPIQFDDVSQMTDEQLAAELRAYGFDVDKLRATTEGDDPHGEENPEQTALRPRWRVAREHSPITATHNSNAPSASRSPSRKGPARR